MREALVEPLVVPMAANTAAIAGIQKLVGDRHSPTVHVALPPAVPP